MDPIRAGWMHNHRLLTATILPEFSSAYETVDLLHDTCLAGSCSAGLGSNNGDAGKRYDGWRRYSRIRHHPACDTVREPECEPDDLGSTGAGRDRNFGERRRHRPGPRRWCGCWPIYRTEQQGMNVACADRWRRIVGERYGSNLKRRPGVGAVPAVRRPGNAALPDRDQPLLRAVSALALGKVSAASQRPALGPAPLPAL